MTQKMLIDASHPEETRVAILDGNRLEAFDFESANKRQIKGNVYLAKVTRVEPSLQACFVDYGGNRQGFLAFSEIHPDYYQIPVSDREELLRAEEEEDVEIEAAEAVEESTAPEPLETPADGDRVAESSPQADAFVLEEGSENPLETQAESLPSAQDPLPERAPPGVETVGGDEAEEARSWRKQRPSRRYKIQEVIKRRQILLVQIVKEERGNKGAAMTSYISLPGRYCVLMPNSARSGVSRKINNYTDRKRMKTIISSLEVPDGMAVILRTAGADRPKADIKRDCDYLLKVWDEIRDTTLQSTAPAMIYEEGNLVKRAIRDLYNRDIEQVYVEGDEGYKVAKNLMKVLTPSHARKVQQYKDKNCGLFQKFQVENQIDAVHDNRVELPSGGYIIIDQTEALVAVDVNSGRSTRERNIEETALRTNIEAAEEIARQMRLRDLAGLIVIDFIDMEHHGNKVAVERKFKEAARKDRARMQIGRISHFGLLEMTRQRLRPSVLETSSHQCPHCSGSGKVRSTESSALVALRALEEDLSRRSSVEIKLFLSNEVAMYLLNHKRATLSELETTHSAKILILADNALMSPAYRIERIRSDGTREESDSNAENADSANQRPGRNKGGRRDRGSRFDNGGRKHKNDRPHQQPVLADDGGEADGNFIPEERQIDDNIGNKADDGQAQAIDTAEGGERHNNRNGRRERGGRGRRGRGRFNRNRGERPQNGQNGDNPNYKGRAHNAAGEPDSHSNSGSPGHSDQDAEQSPQNHSYAGNTHGNDVTSYTPEDTSVSGPESGADNVELVTGTPDNPKRGWWKKIGS